MRLVTSAQMREIDRRTIEEFDIKGEVLMERAGSGVANLVRRIAEINGFMNPVIHLIAGRGQNGGDAFVAARQLKEYGMTVEVWVAAHLNQISGDALIHFSRMKAAGIEAYEIPTLEDWREMKQDSFYAEIIVDGVLGTGLKGPARGPAAGAIQYMRARAQDSLVVSIDIPSGLDADTGQAGDDTVIADVTTTIGLPKVGLITQGAVDFVGSLDVVDIGIPRELLEELPPAADMEFLHLTDLKDVLVRRRRSAHKGDFGHLLVVAGSRRHSGAALLCARAALRSGAGLVTALVPERLQSAIVSHTPELMVWPGMENHQGALAADNLVAILEALPQFDALVVGPGLTVNEDSRALVAGILEHARVPVVLDADALNVYANQAKSLRQSQCPLVITPHPGELARLVGVTTGEVQQDRGAAIRRAMEATNATVVLKGAGTLISSPGKAIHVNLNGNPGMATAGSGDVLAGVIGGLLAQHLSPHDAACAGVFAHGRAGDYGSWRRCQAGMIAGDIIEELPYAIRDLTLR